MQYLILVAAHLTSRLIAAGAKPFMSPTAHANVFRTRSGEFNSNETTWQYLKPVVQLLAVVLGFILFLVLCASFH